MQYFKPALLIPTMLLFGMLSACTNEPSLENAILGTWVQETPYSITDRGLQTTTTDTVLQIKKNGKTHLTRNLDIIGQDLPETGISVSVELRGNWGLTEGKLSQTPETVIVIPRNEDQVTRKWADELQAQAEKSPTSVKTIVSANKEKLILQDADTGTTDVYRRK